MNYKQRLKILVLLFLPFPLIAQHWAEVRSWPGGQNETCEGLAIDSEGRLFMAGSYEPGFSFGNQPLPVFGESDIYLCRLSENGTPQWALGMGSPLDDDVADLCLDRQGNVILGGAYWSKGIFEDTTLESTRNPKALFVLRFDPDGHLRWGRSFEGTALKALNDICTDDQGNIYAAGFFQDSLFLEDTILTASGKTDLFLVKLDPQGNLIWAERAGATGDTRAEAVVVSAGGQVVVTGIFNDTILLGENRFTANTFDWDVFLTAYSPDGQTLWARKAGGVIDDEVTSLVSDPSGRIYLTGFLVGVMTLSDQISIQSSTGQSDFYLLQYGPDGVPLQARAMGGPLVQQAFDIDRLGNTTALCGFFQGPMTIDGFAADAGNASAGFIAGFDPQNKAVWLKTIPSDFSVFPAQIAFSSNASLWVAGSFLGRSTFDDQIIEAPSDFDLFLARLDIGVTSENTPAREDFPVQVFPNPVSDRIFIQTEAPDYQIYMLDLQGRKLFSASRPDAIDMSSLPDGTYLLVIHHFNKTKVVPVLKKSGRF